MTSVDWGSGAVVCVGRICISALDGVTVQAARNKKMENRAKVGFVMNAPYDWSFICTVEELLR
jgi:hypothetical protein